MLSEVLIDLFQYVFDKIYNISSYTRHTVQNSSHAVDVTCVIVHNSPLDSPIP